VGIGFVSTPDDTKIVSTGLFLLFPSAAGPSQEAFVTPTSAPFSDSRLNPPLTNQVDNIDQPSVSADSRYACYTATVGGVSGLYANDLVNSGAAVAFDTAPSGGYIGGLQIAPDSRTMFYKKGPLNSVSPAPMMYTNISQPGTVNAFSPLGTGAVTARNFSIAPDGSAVVFDSGTSVYLSSWGHFDSATLLLALDASAAYPQFSYSADSNALAIAGAGTPARLSVSSPKTGDVYVATSSTTTGVRCFSFVGSGCWF
jgi:WD40-like Beta Propeller Repeat